MPVTPPLKWHGGKHYLATKIIALMPGRCRTPNAPAPDDSGWLHYVEPYFGGGAVLLAQNPDGISEVANDVNGELMNFWRVLQQEPIFGQMRDWLEAVPFSEAEFAEAGPEYIPNPKADVLRAVKFFVRCRQSLAGRMKGFASLTRNRTRRGMNEQAAAWLSAVDGLSVVHGRLRRVVILNRDALDVIRQQDGPRTLFYLDPPYLHETRATTGEYEHEMTSEQHADLLCVLSSLKGRFLLSGYRSKLYDDHATLHRWHRTDFDLPNNAAGGDSKRRMVESVWTNYAPVGGA